MVTITIMMMKAKKVAQAGINPPPPTNNNNFVCDDHCQRVWVAAETTNQVIKNRKKNYERILS